MTVTRHLGLSRLPLWVRLAIISVFLGLVPIRASGQSGTEPATLDGLPTFVAQGQLPFWLSSGYLIEVEGRIGRQGNLKFLLDTGSTISIVDRHIADNLKLQRHRAESLSFEKKLAWEVGTVPEVQFGPIKAQNVQMLVGSLAEYSEFAKKADAIIGLDLLKMSNFSIEFEKKKIIFHPAEQRPSVSSNDPLANCLVLEAQVQGQPLRLLVDTGFPGILLYEEQVRQRIPSLRVAGNVTNVVVGKNLKAKQAIVTHVALGGTIRDLTVLFVTSPSPEMLHGIDGIVGITALKARRVHFDFVEKTVNWE